LHPTLLPQPPILCEQSSVLVRDTTTLYRTAQNGHRSLECILAQSVLLDRFPTRWLIDAFTHFYYSAVLMINSRRLGGFETLLLLSILRLGERAYGVSIRQELVERTGRDVAVGAIYTGLDRLAKKALVESWRGDPTAERGGRAKRFYRITAAGLEALNHKHQSMQGMLDGLDLTTEDAHA
jgi:PadR family transcriptional regulator PadR